MYTNTATRAAVAVACLTSVIAAAPAASAAATTATRPLRTLTLPPPTGRYRIGVAHWSCEALVEGGAWGTFS